MIKTYTEESDTKPKDKLENQPPDEGLELPTSLFKDMFQTRNDSEIQDTLDFYVMDEAKILTTYDFVVFHCLVFDIIDTWTIEAKSKTDPFITKWRHLKF
jgi:hypothetical protein